MVCLNAYLLEPIVAQCLGCIFGLDKIPGPLTVGGMFAVALATLYINRGTHIMIKEKKRILPWGDYEDRQSEKMNVVKEGRRSIPGTPDDADE